MFMTILSQPLTAAACSVGRKEGGGAVGREEEEEEDEDVGTNEELMEELLVDCVCVWNVKLLKADWTLIYVVQLRECLVVMLVEQEV